MPVDLTTSRDSPVADYTVGDFDGLTEAMQSYAQEEYGDVWTDFNANQLGVVLLEGVAYCGDLLDYKLNASLRELYTPTVLRRQNLIALGKPLDFEPYWPKASSVTLELTLDPDGTYPFTLNNVDNVFSNGNSEGDEVFFTPESNVNVAAYSSTISISCVEGERWVNQLIGVSTGKAGQRWQLPQESVIQDSIVVYVGAELWTRVERNNFIYAQSTSKVYKVVATDEGQTFIIFGGEGYGQVPATGTQIFASFRVGGGKRGNLARNAIENIVSSHPNVLSVTNPARATGGDDAQDMKSARQSIPASLRTLDRAVNEKDHADLALQVDGVAKARAEFMGNRTIAVTVAPVSGGQPTTLLKSAVSEYLKQRKMAATRVRVLGPTYRTIRLDVLLHINSNFRAGPTSQVARASIINNNGTGILDFSQLDFGGVQEDSDGTTKLLLSQTRLQSHFDKLKSFGVDRAEIIRFDAEPTVYPRASGNAGDGGISEVVLSGSQRRREYEVVLTSANTYDVFEYIVGRITKLDDNTLRDETKIFENESDSFSGFVLKPERSGAYSVPVTSVLEQSIEVASNVSLFSLASVGDEYALYNPTPTGLVVGDEYVSPDGSVRFTLEAGMFPFIKGDSFSVSVYPTVGDIELGPGEYPELLDENFIVRTSGGAKV